MFSADDYKKPRGFCHQTYPSLKYPDDHKALWQGLADDGVSAMATDEFPTTLKHKLLGKRIDNVTGGNLGAEARMGRLKKRSRATISTLVITARGRGWPVEGWPTTTILRGKVIVGKLGDGHLVPRKIDPVVLRRPAS